MSASLKHAKDLRERADQEALAALDQMSFQEVQAAIRRGEVQAGDLENLMLRKFVGRVKDGEADK